MIGIIIRSLLLAQEQKNKNIHLHNMHIYIKNLMNIKQIDTSTSDEVLQLIKEIYVQIIYAFMIN